jgi:ribosome-binding factor A
MMTMPYRPERAGTFILEELTRLVRNDLRDPRVADVIITGVDVTKDRRIARVYVANYAGEEALKEALQGLESAKPYLRRHLAQVLHWNFAPAIEFRTDRSYEYGQRIDALLDQIHQEEQETEGDVKPE